MFSPRLPLISRGFGCLLQRSGTQTLTTNVETAIIMDTIVHNDFLNFGDLTVSTTKIIFPYTSWYYVWGGFQWVTNTTGSGYGAVKWNGGFSNINYIATRYRGSNDGDQGYVNVSGVFKFAQNDYIELYGLHNQGSNSNIAAGAYLGTVRVGS
jgi:hypothetical protein